MLKFRTASLALNTHEPIARPKLPESLEARRIKALEEALLEYVGRYGISDLAKAAFSVGVPKRSASAETLRKYSQNKETNLIAGP